MIRYRARWVLPISARPIEHGVVAVYNGRIAYVGDAARAPAGTTNDLGDAVLMPGLVNAHTHLELTALRGFLEDLDFPRWIKQLQAAKEAVFDRERFLDAARLGIVEGLRAGITTYADTCDSGVAFDAMREAGVRGIMYQEVFGPNAAIAAASLADLAAKISSLRPRETPLVRVGVSPHAPFTVSDELFRAVSDYAKQHRLPVAVHIAESEAERQYVEEGSGVFADALRKRGIAVSKRARSSIDLLHRLGVLARKPLLIHCVRVDAADIACIAGAASSAAHCPMSNARLKHGTAPLVALLAAGIPVGLGSDSMASNDHMDILAEAGTAVRQHASLDAGAALQLATLGGARALGLDAEIGSLDEGKSADLAAFPLTTARSAVDDAVAAAVLAQAGRTASLVTVAGRELVRDGEVVSTDPELQERVNDTTRRIREWARSE